MPGVCDASASIASAARQMYPSGGRATATSAAPAHSSSGDRAPVSALHEGPDAGRIGEVSRLRAGCSTGCLACQTWPYLSATRAALVTMTPVRICRLRNASCERRMSLQLRNERGGELESMGDSGHIGWGPKAGHRALERRLSGHVSRPQAGQAYSAPSPRRCARTSPGPRCLCSFGCYP